jgi:hypothetical protein
VNYVDPLGLCGWREPWNCADEAVGAAQDGIDTVTDKLTAAAQYCLTSDRLFECYERLEVGTVGVAVTVFGVAIVATPPHYGFLGHLSGARCAQQSAREGWQSAGLRSSPEPSSPAVVCS